MNIKERKFYTGIGGRNTPKEVCSYFTELASQLEMSGFCLRSGGANGADLAFEKGVVNNKEIYLPWNKFNGNDSDFILENPIPKNVLALVKQFYKRYDYVSDVIIRLHARNVYQVLGEDLNRLSEFVVCWTDRNNFDTGGSQFGMHLARSFNIPVFNLFNEEEAESFKEYLAKLNILCVYMNN